MVKEIVCSKCKLKQSVSNKCLECNTQFGKYFCSICNLFDDTDKGQFHCNLCGLCRVGGETNFFHCQLCNMCISVGIKDEHHKKCNENSYNQDCAFCQEDMFTSVKQLHTVKCGHVFHLNCVNKNLEQNNYKCPYCSKAMIDISSMYKFLDHEIASVQMPDEYKDVIYDILCNECEKKSQCKFHVAGLKCSLCGGYNTRRV